MPIHIDWTDPTRTAILETFDAEWTWDEFLKVTEVEQVLMSQATGPIHIVADMRQTTLPEGVMQIMPRVVAASSANAWSGGGCYIIVGGSRLLETFAGIHARAYAERGYEVCFADTLEEAYALLGQYKSAAM